MRSVSAAVSKGRSRQGVPRNQLQIPSEGTYIRAVYDVLMANKGKPVEISFRDFGINHHSSWSLSRPFAEE